MKRILPGKPLPVAPSPRDLARFLKKLVIGPVPDGFTTPCWLWQGCKDKNGYGMFWFAGQCRWAARYVYEAIHGPLEPGDEVDHMCHVRHCCNWHHLEAKPALVNRGRQKKRKAAVLDDCPI